MWDRYYDEEKSEIEEVLDEFKERLVDIVLTDAKAEVDAIIDRNKSLTELNSRLKSENSGLKTENKKLTEHISELENEITKKYLDMSTTKFQLGEYVYVADEGDRQSYKCPVCDGTGTVYLTKDNVVYNAGCPKCSYGIKDRKERLVSVVLYRQIKKKIVEISVDVTSEKFEAKYRVENDSYWKSEDRLFKTSAECQSYITKYNECKIEEAKKSVGIVDAD